MKIKIITYAKSLFSKIRFRSTTNVGTGRTTYSVSRGIRRPRIPRISTSRRIRVGSHGSYTVTTNPRTGTRITHSTSLTPRRTGGIGVRVSHSFTSTPRIRTPRVRKVSTRIRTPGVKRSYSYKVPRVRTRTSSYRVSSGVRRSYSSTPKIRTYRPRVRTGSYRVRRRY